MDILLLLLSSYIMWKICDSFQTASMFLGQKMPIGTRGATINAIGSSLPEFLTSVIAVFHYSANDGAMFGIANTTGTVIYNITVIPFCVFVGCYFFKNLKSLAFNKAILIRDGIFLIFLQLVLLFIISKGKFTMLDSLTLIFLYIIYLIIIFCFSKKKKLKRSVKKEMSAPIKSKGFIKSLLDIDLYNLLFRKNVKQNYTNSFIVLFISIVILYFACKILVARSYNIGVLFNIPSYFIALTITAIATSLPDTIISVKDARIGEFDDAITNAFGSNIFNISFCIGFPILIYNIVCKSDIYLSRTAVENINALKNLSIALIILIVAIFTVRNKFWFLKGILLLSIYIIFLMCAFYKIII